LTRPRLLLVALVAAAGLAWLVARLVVTDAEAVTAVLETAADDANRGDWDAVTAAFDDDFREAGRDRTAYVAWVRGVWRSASLRAIALDVLDVRVEGDQAAARVEVRLSPSSFKVPGRVDLERRGDTWRIVRAAPDNPSYLGR
jgi:hypothetical protein